MKCNHKLVQFERVNIVQLPLAIRKTSFCLGRVATNVTLKIPGHHSLVSKVVMVGQNHMWDNPNTTLYDHRLLRIFLFKILKQDLVPPPSHN